ncbi:hypothetical protein BDR26DRAFT_856838 [Obelidium mucronatum]|nr:hypothetical protein BDR26DRAFT_856838 [Obelidium mucronatum]
MSLASLAANLPLLSTGTTTHVLIRDQLRADGFFAVHHFAHQSQTQLNNNTTIWVSFTTNTQSHYEVVARKLGYTLRSPKFAFIDALPILTAKNDKETILNTVFTNIQKQFESLSAKTSTATTVKPAITLILDEVSVLSSLGIDSKTIVEFILKCRSLVESTGASGHLIISAHDDIRTPDHESVIRFIADSIVNYEIHVQGLESGYSDHATGLVKIIPRTSAAKEAALTAAPSNQLLYLVTESGIKLWVPGNSH